MPLKGDLLNIRSDGLESAHSVAKVQSHPKELAPSPFKITHLQDCQHQRHTLLSLCSPERKGWFSLFQGGSKNKRKGGTGNENAKKRRERFYPD